MASNAQFNEDQVAKHYAALRDSLATADSLLASGNRSSALAIYQTTTPWKHNAGWRYRKHLKCTIGPEQVNRATLDSLSKYGCDSTFVESDSLFRHWLGPVVKSGSYPSLRRSPLEQMVDSLGELDQQIRDQPMSEAQFRELGGRRDSMNLSLLYPAFLEYGGYVPSMGSILILIHALSEHQDHLDYFAQAITDALMNQKLDSYTYGAIVDQFFWHTKNCQVYGTVGHSDGSVPNLKWCDPERTMRLRKLIGLPEATE